MKKILIVLSLFATIYTANAQVKSASDAKKAVESAEASVQNPKKAAKANTWIKLGNAYVGAYDSPIGNIWLGASKTELALVMGSEKPSSTEQVVLNGEQLTKEVYDTKNLYFRANGQLAMIEVTRPVYQDALDRAYAAYCKAYEVDAQKSTKVVKSAFKTISDKNMQDAFTLYQLGKYAESSVKFEKAAKAVGTAPSNQIDTNAIYNAGFTAWLAKDMPRAKVFFEKCYELGYYAADGEIFSKLADIDTLKSKSYLEEGFEKFPQSQSILIGLINYYIKNNENPNKLFTLLDKAKKNEPNNASLYYVEGNIYSKLGDVEKAVEAYEQCSKIDPNYEFGYIGEGIVYYNQALDLQTQAQNELNDIVYMKLAAKFEKCLKNCIEPFEKAFAISKDESVKRSIAEYLKNAYYRFRDQGDKYRNGYEKYDAIASGKLN